MRLENASRRAKFFLDRVPQRAGEFWRRSRRRSRRRFRRGRGFRCGLRREWGQDREVDEGGHGWKEACQLPRSHPEVGRAQVGGIGCAAEEVLDGMVGCVAPRAQWGVQSPNPVGIISHG